RWRVRNASRAQSAVHEDRRRCRPSEEQAEELVLVSRHPNRRWERVRREEPARVAAQASYWKALGSRNLLRGAGTVDTATRSGRNGIHPRSSQASDREEPRDVPRYRSDPRGSDHGGGRHAAPVSYETPVLGILRIRNRDALVFRLGSRRQRTSMDQGE